MDDTKIGICDIQEVQHLFALARRERVVVHLAKSPAVFWRAVCDNQLVGFAQMVFLSPTRARLSNLFVLPAYRRRGIGGALIRARLDTVGGLCVDTYTYWPTIYEPYGFAIVRHRITSNGDTYYMRRSEQ